MIKQPQTYYAIVAANSSELPSETKAYGTIMRGGEIKMTQWNNERQVWINYHSQVTHWLSEQQGVILSVEEWEKVQKCIELLLKVIDGCKARVWLGSALTEAENILSQLNKDI